MKNQRDRMIHEALRVLPYGLYVFGVRGKADGELNAMAVSWACNVPLSPR